MADPPGVVLVQRVADANGVLVSPKARAIKFASYLTVVARPDAQLVGATGGSGQVTGCYEVGLDLAALMAALGAQMSIFNARIENAGGQTTEFYVPIYEAAAALHLTRLQFYPQASLAAKADHWQLTVARSRGGVPTALVEASPGVGINLNTGATAWNAPMIFSPLTEVGAANDVVFAKFTPTGLGVDPFPPFVIFVGASPA